MDRTKYNQMVHAQDAQHSNAWNFIITSWHTNEWRAIPQNIRNILGLPASLGMYSGMLISKPAADGAREFIQRMNNRKI
jgi:hypothetical protein